MLLKHFIQVNSDDAILFEGCIEQVILHQIGAQVWYTPFFLVFKNRNMNFITDDHLLFTGFSYKGKSMYVSSFFTPYIYYLNHNDKS